MATEDFSSLKTEYAKYLHTLGIASLRSLGRYVGVDKPTKSKKKDLIGKIVGILVKEIIPVPLSKRGAPVKADKVSPEVLDSLDSICFRLSGERLFGDETSESTTKDLFGGLTHIENVLSVRASGSGETSSVLSFCKGQLVKMKNFYCLFPLDGRGFEENIFIDNVFIEKYSLKEGDVLSCYKKKNDAGSLVTEIVKINDVSVESYVAGNFDELEVCTPQESFSLKSCKYLDWFLPIAKGGRCLIVSPPKAGKTTLLKNISAEMVANKKLKTLGLLIDQSPESVADFRKIYPVDELVYTTYEEEADAHVFTADFLLKRAKSYASSGADVCLIIEGLQSLAKAYDEIDFENGKMLSCGLRAKTLRYVKRYLGSARALIKGGSLTIVCATSVDTGNQEDDFFFSEISAIFNQQICLSNALAVKRIFPAIDLADSFIAESEKMLDEEKNAADHFIREVYLPTFGAESLSRLIAECDNVGELKNRAISEIEKRS